MITTYTLQYAPTLPPAIVKDGVTFARREITARNVRTGDLTPFVDMTGPANTAGTFAIGEIVDVFSTPAGRGRSYVAPWRRRTLTVRGYRGNLRSFQVPPATSDCAHDDRVTVYRASQAQPTSAAWEWDKLARCSRYIGSGQYVDA
jgi:hypothetical protein